MNPSAASDGAVMKPCCCASVQFAELVKCNITRLSVSRVGACGSSRKPFPAAQPN